MIMMGAIPFAPPDFTFCVACLPDCLMLLLLLLLPLYDAVPRPRCCAWCVFNARRLMAA